MKIKVYLSKCEEVLIVKCNGETYPFDVDKNVLNQAFNLSKQFAERDAPYVADERFKPDRLVLSVNLPDKMPSRANLGA